MILIGICALLSHLAFAQVLPTGSVSSPDVDLAYWVLGAPQAATPVIAVNGGPGLSHIYMLQNDVWQRLAKGRQIVFYDQRGTGASTLRNPDAPQTMEAQVADLDAVRARFIQMGYAVDDNVIPMGYPRFYVRDPWGNQFEILPEGLP